MSKKHILATCLALAMISPAVAKPAQSPMVPSVENGMHINNRVYAACTQAVLKALGPPPSLAAHFGDLWAQQAFECAVNNSSHHG